MKLYKRKSLRRGWHKGYENYLFFLRNKRLQQKALPKEEKEKAINYSLKRTNTEKQNVAILNKTRIRDCGTGLWYAARRRNTLATQTGEDKDFIHMREGNTGANNQGLGMTSDQEHRRKGT